MTRIATREYLDRQPLNRDQMAARVAADIPPGSYVNLGIGLPTRVSNHLDPAAGVVLHTENGMLGMGPEAVGEDIDPDLINAGKVPVTELPGAAYFHHADSFAMIRGGHLDVCVMGAFQVSQRGDLANWHTGEADAIPAVGGAMDLATGAKAVFVMMNLFAKDGAAKLVAQCDYPLTGLGCVSRIYTDYAVFEIGSGGVCAVSTYSLSVADLQGRINLPIRRIEADSAPAG
ncbi:3-oxoacid CoA-transferase subunit B [Mycolicibacterium cosmeticum]|uniref:3-oxoacid CoA-transferase subunit B n=2 Tax=Mycobacteriaceae TaxID=1762 RepID=UPI003204A5BF